MRLSLTIAPLLATATLAAPTCSRWCGGSSHGQCLGDRCFCAAGWTGEDCGTDPYVSPTGQSITNKCHTVNRITETTEDDMVTIVETFDYSLSVESYIGNPSLSSSVTAFPNPSTEKYEFRVSYFLEDVDMSKCWAWGVDPSYFNDRNCFYPSRQQDISESGSIRIILD